MTTQVHQPASPGKPSRAASHKSVPYNTSYKRMDGIGTAPTYARVNGGAPRPWLFGSRCPEYITQARASNVRMAGPIAAAKLHRNLLGALVPVPVAWQVHYLSYPLLPTSIT